MVLKILKYSLITAAAVIILAGILYAFNGSLEAFPTDEQQGKARIGAGLIIILGVITGAAGLLIKTKRK